MHRRRCRGRLGPAGRNPSLRRLGLSSVAQLPFPCHGTAARRRAFERLRSGRPGGVQVGPRWVAPIEFEDDHAMRKRPQCLGQVWVAGYYVPRVPGPLFQPRGQPVTRQRPCRSQPVQMGVRKTVTTVSLEERLEGGLVAGAGVDGAMRARRRSRSWRRPTTPPPGRPCSQSACTARALECRARQPPGAWSMRRCPRLRGRVERRQQFRPRDACGAGPGRPLDLARQQTRTVPRPI